MSVEDPDEAERKLRGEIPRDIDIEDPEECEPLVQGVYKTAEFSPDSLRVTGGSPNVGWLIEDDEFSESVVEIFYSPEGISLCTEGRDGDLWGGGSVGLTTDGARDLAIALYQAAEERDRRREVTDS